MLRRTAIKAPPGVRGQRVPRRTAANRGVRRHARTRRCTPVNRSILFIVISMFHDPRHGCLVFRLSGSPVVRLSGCPVVRLSACSAVRLQGCPAVQLSACLGHGRWAGMTALPPQRWPNVVRGRVFSLVWCSDNYNPLCRVICEHQRFQLTPAIHYDAQEIQCHGVSRPLSGRPHQKNNTRAVGPRQAWIGQVSN